ncbi:MAG TPA: HGGxSTG domain-containing protein [Acetobacteraceae bacterium]|nr:HGGxSTG domain-containing protein [Acetobacteraceae bacterium]
MSRRRSRPPSNGLPHWSLPPLHLDPVGPRPGARNGPLRSGNPRGNPNLAPGCWARAKRTGCACRAPAMANGRCRMHGGKSTGPRRLEALARIAAARTTHGAYAQIGRDGTFGRAASGTRFCCDGRG